MKKGIKELRNLGLIRQENKFSVAGPLHNKLFVAGKQLDFNIFFYLFPSDLLVVVEKGDVRKKAENGEILVRIQSACFMGDVLRHKSCECGNQLLKTLNMINEKGGLLIYGIKHEGRAIGHYNHFLSYLRQQNLNEDTFTSFRRLGHAEDERDYTNIIEVIKDYDIKKIGLLTSNPEKIAVCKNAGFIVRRIPLELPSEHNFQHFIAKQQKGFMYTKETLDRVRNYLNQNI